MTPGPRPATLPPLFTGAFLVLCLVNFLAFCNLAIFYGFHDHLQALGVPEGWRGPLLALEPLAAFLLRPALSPLITPRNGVRYLGLGLGLVCAALVSYGGVHGLAGLAAVRVLHGAGFAVLVSAVIAQVVHVIPRERTGQGFGVFTLTTLVPYAAMPFFVEQALPLAGDLGRVYALAAPLMVPALLCLPALARNMRALSPMPVGGDPGRPGLAEILANARGPGIRPLLAVGLGLYTATSAAFFFFRPLGVAAGLANPGLFFTCSTLANIGLRVLASHVFDRVDKRLVLGGSLGLLALVLAGTALAGSPGALIVLGLLYGLGQGLAMPMLNALMVLVSPARMKSANANLLLFTMDAGYFLGPLAGGAAAAVGLGLVFWMAAGLALISSLVLALSAPALRKAVADAS